MGNVAALNSYPLSGARALELQTANIGPAGIAHDRQYVCFDPGVPMTMYEPGQREVLVAHKRMSQKNLAALARVEASIDGDGMLLARVDDAELRVSSAVLSRYDRFFVNEFGDPTPCTRASEAISERLSQMLGGRAVGLAMKTPEWMAGKGIDPAKRRVVPLHIINQASVEALQTIGRDQGMQFSADRFRANIVVDGFDAFAEREWTDNVLQIGSVAVKIHRPTERCKIPGIDQLSGEQKGDVPRLLAEMHEGRGMADFGVYGYPIDLERRLVTIGLGDEVKLITQG